MTVWAISVAGIILLTVLSDIIIPDGKTSKYIKTVTTLVAILAMLSPLPGILKGDFGIETFIGESKSYQYDQNYLAYVYTVQTSVLEDKCVKVLAEQGIEDFSVNISASVEDYKVCVKNVVVKVEKLVINNSSGNIVIVENIKKTVSELFSISKAQVTVYGKS